MLDYPERKRNTGMFTFPSISAVFSKLPTSFKNLSRKSRTVALDLRSKVDSVSFQSAQSEFSAKYHSLIEFLPGGHLQPVDFFIILYF